MSKEIECARGLGSGYGYKYTQGQVWERSEVTICILTAHKVLAHKQTLDPTVHCTHTQTHTEAEAHTHTLTIMICRRHITPRELLF